MRSDLLFPYKVYPTEFPCSISKVELDGSKPPGAPVLADYRTVHLFDVTEAAWSEVSLEVQVEAATAELAQLAPNPRDISLWVVVSCGATNVRQTFKLPRTKATAAQWRGSIALDRDNYSGKATLTAVLVGEVDGVSGRPLGSSQDWALHFDAPAVPLLGGALRVEWHNFRSSDAPVLARLHPDAPYVADLDANSPAIYLNSALPYLRAVLEKPSSRTPEVQRVLHETFRMGLARSVWMAMFSSSVGAIDMDEDDNPVWPSSEWKQSVLKQLLGKLYPSKSEIEALQEAYMAHREGLEGLASQAEAALGEHLEANKVIRKALHRLASKEMVK